MEEFFYILKIKKKIQMSNPMSKFKNQSDWLVFDYNKHAYEWTFSVSEDNGIMVDAWLVMEFENNL